MAPPQSKSLKVTQNSLPFVHEDIIFNHILIRLPVKSLARFRLVSKSWHSLLKNSNFARDHLKFQTESSIFLTKNTFVTANLANESCNIFSEELPIPPSNQIKSASFGGSCHGLVLVKETRKSDRNEYLNLFNPITLENRIIPNFHDYDDEDRCGLGYDSKHDDYKIVLITRQKPPVVGIYSVKMGTWIDLGRLSHGAVDSEPGLFVNGRIHWVSTYRKPLAIAAFNVTKNKFEKLKLPKGINRRSWNFNLTILRGCLALEYSSYESTEYWVTKEYGVKNSWTKFITIPEHVSFIREVDVLGEDEIVFLRKIVDGNLELVAYDRRKGGGWRKMPDAGKLPSLSFKLRAKRLNFKESLVSLRACSTSTV